MSSLDELIKSTNKKFKSNKEDDDIIHYGLPQYNFVKVPFTSPRLNYMTFGGLPVGKLIEFSGPEHSGKTTTALDIIANYQRMDIAKKVIYIDAENTLDTEWALKLGVDTDNMILMQSTNQSAEEIFQFVLDAVNTGEVGLVIMDSIAVLVTEQAMGKDMTEKTYAGVSGPLTTFSNKVVGPASKNECMIIGINQVRDNLNSPYGGTSTPGGHAWKHNCFSGNTRFVTDRGLRRFRDCKDGEIVTVVDKDGELREAVVHHFGEQKLQRVKFHTPNQKFEVLCTPNHRWILSDGSITENLKVGDKLWYHNDNAQHTNKYTGWVVEHITPAESGETYCVEEPVTHSFTLEKGIVTGNCSVRLEFRRGKFIDDKGKEISRNSENPQGNIVDVVMLKNKTCPPTRKNGFYTLRYDTGIDYLADLTELAIKYDIISQSGAWFTIQIPEHLDEETGEVIPSKILVDKIHGQSNVYDILSDDSNLDILKIVEELVDKYISEN